MVVLAEEFLQKIIQTLQEEHPNKKVGTKEKHDITVTEIAPGFIKIKPVNKLNIPQDVQNLDSIKNDEKEVNFDQHKSNLLEGYLRFNVMYQSSHY